MILVLDTHALVWYLAGDCRLSQRVRGAIQGGNHDLIIPAIAAAELTHLRRRGRIPFSGSDIGSLLARVENVTVFPIDMQIIDAMPVVLDIHDSLVVATALLLEKTRDEEVRLVTQDEAILRVDLVKVLW